MDGCAGQRAARERLCLMQGLLHTLLSLHHPLPPNNLLHPLPLLPTPLPDVLSTSLRVQFKAHRGHAEGFACEDVSPQASAVGAGSIRS